MPYRVSQMVALLCLNAFILTGGKISGHTSVEFTSLSDLVFFKKGGAGRNHLASDPSKPF